MNDVLDGLSKCSHAKFAKHFANICSLQGQSLLGMNDIPGNMLEQIKKIFADTIAAFTSFNLAGKWHILIYMPMLVGIVMAMTTMLLSFLNPRTLNCIRRIVMLSMSQAPIVVTPGLRSPEQAGMDTLEANLVHPNQVNQFDRSMVSGLVIAPCANRTLPIPLIFMMNRMMARILSLVLTPILWPA